MNRTVPFRSKRPEGATPWIEFGSSKEQFEFWIPHLCGPIGLTMAAAGFDLTPLYSLYELALKAKEMGVFVEVEGGAIAGAFHYPLLKLAMDLGLGGQVVVNLDDDAIRTAIRRGEMALASIDLGKATCVARGSHLVLVHGLTRGDTQFVLHDCADLLGNPGRDVCVDIEVFSTFSNRKGLFLWRK